MPLQQVEELGIGQLARLHRTDQRGQLLRVEASGVEVAVDLILDLALQVRPVPHDAERPFQRIAHFEHDRGEDAVLPCPLDLRAPERFGLAGFVCDHPRAEHGHALLERLQRLAQFGQASARELEEVGLRVRIGERPRRGRADVEGRGFLVRDVARDDRRRQAREVQAVAVVRIDLVVRHVGIDEVDQRRLVHQADDAERDGRHRPAQHPRIGLADQLVLVLVVDAKHPLAIGPGLPGIAHQRHEVEHAVTVLGLVVELARADPRFLLEHDQHQLPHVVDPLVAPVDHPLDAEILDRRTQPHLLGHRLGDRRHAFRFGRVIDHQAERAVFEHVLDQPLRHLVDRGPGKVDVGQVAFQRAGHFTGRRLAEGHASHPRNRAPGRVVEIGALDPARVGRVLLVGQLGQIGRAALVHLVLPIDDVGAALPLGGELVVDRVGGADTLGLNGHTKYLLA